MLLSAILPIRATLFINHPDAAVSSIYVLVSSRGNDQETARPLPPQFAIHGCDERFFT
jgi:hypothetical protein